MISTYASLLYVEVISHSGNEKPDYRQAGEKQKKGIGNQEVTV
jgi:hypothetical protein